VSNSLAIATVTAALRSFLLEELDNDPLLAEIGRVDVATHRPEAVAASDKHKSEVGIFLYLVAPNPAWRNAEIERRYTDPRAPRDPNRNYIEKRALVPLNLSYLFTFYGDDSRLIPQQLLGSVVSALHAHPRLSPKDILQGMELYKNQLRNADLAEQVERIEYVTLTPINLNLEEMSKIWSVFFQVPYALSVAYQASTVLIEPGEPRRIKPVETVSVKPAAPGVRKLRHFPPWLKYTSLYLRKQEKKAATQQVHNHRQKPHHPWRKRHAGS
jgi:hypothetical protein